MEAMEITFADVYKISMAIISPLVAAIVYMYLTKRRDDKRNSIEMKDLYRTMIAEQKENIRSLTEISRDSKNALENNTRATENSIKMMDKLFDRITSATK